LDLIKLATSEVNRIVSVKNQFRHATHDEVRNYNLRLFPRSGEYGDEVAPIINSNTPARGFPSGNDATVIIDARGIIVIDNAGGGQPGIVLIKGRPVMDLDDAYNVAVEYLSVDFNKLLASGFVTAGMARAR